MNSHLIHPLSDVKTDMIGEGTRIWQYAVVLAGAVIGKNCNINCHTFIEDAVIIGDNVTIKPGVYIWNGVELRENVFVGPCVAFTNDVFPRSGNKNFQLQKTVVGRNSSIGANCTILPGVVVDEYCLIGAGSVLTKKTGPHELWLGNPARRVGYVCRCGNKLNREYFCSSCHSRYGLSGGKLVLRSENDSVSST